VAGSTFTNRNFPYYSQNDFHHTEGNPNTNCAVNDYTNQYNVQYCDLSGLADLMTSSEYVQEQIAGYLNHLAELGVSGIRIDAAKHQNATELAGIIKRLPEGFYVGQEVIGSTGEAVQPSMYYSLGQVSEFYYADNLDANIINMNKMQYLR
jgi:alpha-amylase